MTTLTTRNTVILFIMFVFTILSISADSNVTDSDSYDSIGSSSEDLVVLLKARNDNNNMDSNNNDYFVSINWNRNQLIGFYTLLIVFVVENIFLCVWCLFPHVKHNNHEIDELPSDLIIVQY
eukprot:291782_1